MQRRAFFRRTAALAAGAALPLLPRREPLAAAATPSRPPGLGSGDRVVAVLRDPDGYRLVLRTAEGRCAVTKRVRNNHDE